MKRQATIDIPNLLDIPFSQALLLALRLSGLTLTEVAERMGKGYTTIQRYFNDPTYNPPSYLIPDLCKVLGNNILIEWQVVRVNGIISYLDGNVSDANLQMQISKLTKEFSDVLREDGKAMLDREYHPHELHRMENELEDLASAAACVLNLVRDKRHGIQR